MTDDLMAHAAWECARSTPDADARDVLEPGGTSWMPAQVPGSAAGAVRDADGAEVAAGMNFDESDWWYRTEFDCAGDGPWILRLEGLATDADVWLNGAHVLHSENMFRRYRIDVTDLLPSNILVMRFRALTPRLADRRPRARWRTRLVRSQGLRWWRTSLLGHIRWPGYAVVVGPWRPVTLRPRGCVEFEQRRVHSWVDGDTGVVDVDLIVTAAGGDLAEAHVRVGETVGSLNIDREGDTYRIRGSVRLPHVKLWWPYTHGAQPLYDASVHLDGRGFDLGRVGFRNVQAAREDGGFAVSINGERVFMRGVCWVSPDVLSMNPDDAVVRDALTQLRDAGLNMVRLTGTSAYESDAFWDLCDELGIMVWQDAMLATLDPPDDESFISELVAELHEVFSGLRGRPSLAVLCGGSETEQQATFMGLAPESRAIRVIDDVIPQVATSILPDVPYVSSSPSGGVLPTHVGSGVAHYFGVGGFQRPLSDVRSAGVRFASECLALSNPPEVQSVVRHFGTAAVSGHDAGWKRGVARDAGASWDFEDVRDHYVHELFGLDPASVRRTDPEWALDLGRATVAALAAHVFTEWRRVGSRCAGGLILSGRDVVPGAGWGIVDSDGAPKSIWYALKNVWAPRVLLVCDEGLDGLWVHLVNDHEQPVHGRVEIDAYGVNGRPLISEAAAVAVAGRDSVVLSIDQLVGGFRDLTNAFRFGEPTYDCLRARWIDAAGNTITETTVLTRGQARPRVHDVGLTAQATPLAAGQWTLTISTRDLAQWVAVDIEGFAPSVSWFHLAPGTSREVTLSPTRDDMLPHGHVRAVNSAVAAQVVTS